MRPGVETETEAGLPVDARNTVAVQQQADIVVAGGVESMSRAPKVMAKAEGPYDRSVRVHDTTIGWRFVNPAIVEISERETQRYENPALRVAFRTGTVMGMTVVGIGLLGVTILWIIFQDAAIVAGFAFGASSIALFARVGGLI